MQTQSIKPLLFVPSIRDIQEVTQHWKTFKYDQFVVKFKKEISAYEEGRDFFLDHDYTHFVICPDDLEVTQEGLNILFEDVQKFDPATISGFCNIDETQPDVYALQPLGCDYSKLQTHADAWYNSRTLEKNKIIQVGHSGFGCQIIRRDLVEKIDYMNEESGITGNLDWEFSKLCHKLNIPLLVDTSVFFFHHRFKQCDKITEFKQNTAKFQGHSFLYSNF